VPVEAMLAERPVIGVNNGGLLETITTDTRNGFLCNSNSEEFADAMYTLATNENLVVQMGKNGRQRAIENFSLQLLGSHLDQILKAMVGKKRS